MDVFHERSKFKSAKNRIVTAEDVIAAAPDIIIGSWCGKRVRPERVCARQGFEAVPAVRTGALHESNRPLFFSPVLLP